MLVILNCIFNIITFCFLLYLLYTNSVNAKNVITARRNFFNLQTLMELSEEGWIVSIRSPKGWLIQQSSSQFCKTLGYDWTSDRVNDLVGMLRDDIINVYPLGKIKPFDTPVSVYINQMRKKDGKSIWVETSGTTIFLDEGDIRITLVKSVEHIISKFKDNKGEVDSKLIQHIIFNKNKTG